MSTTTAPKRKRGVQRGKSALVLFSHRSPAGLATFFLVSFQAVFWFASCFLVSCQVVSWFPAAGFLLLSCLGTVVICYSIGVFLRVHKRHSER